MNARNLPVALPALGPVLIAHGWQPVCIAPRAPWETPARVAIVRGGSRPVAARSRTRHADLFAEQITSRITSRSNTEPCTSAEQITSRITSTEPAASSAAAGPGVSHRQRALTRVVRPVPWGKP